MEIKKRTRKKKQLSDAILPIGACLLAVFLTALVCLHSTISTGDPSSRTAEDAQFQLAKNRPGRTGTTTATHQEQQHKRPNDDNDNDNDNDDDEHNHKRNRNSKGYRDPGILDPKITPVEISRVEKLRLAKRPETFPMNDDSNSNSNSNSNDIDSNKKLPYDIHKCPPTIPENYPYAWSVLDVLTHWNPDDTNIPTTIHQGLCAIDWSDPHQRKIAVHYRTSEKPFLVKNHPVIWKAADRWSSYDYLHGKLGDRRYRNEHSPDNHMMYWKLRGKNKRGPLGWKPPTEDVKLSFPDWHQKARDLEAVHAKGGRENNSNNNNNNNSNNIVADTEHYYLRLNGAWEDSNAFLFDELPFFRPDTQNDVFMVDPTDARGINCRLGSRGTIAETHYDMSRNFILILHGQKRYVLGHPDQCTNMELYPKGHPSARHSRINWSDPESWVNANDDGNGNFQHAFVNEVVLEAGDGLYLPTFWLHFIVSLSLNYQCNARSGITFGYQKHISACGF